MLYLPLRSSQVQTYLIRWLITMVCVGNMVFSGVVLGGDGPLRNGKQWVDTGGVSLDGIKKLTSN